jgi:hypothetical protein
MRVPSVSLFSALSFFTRQEKLDPQYPPHLLPENRKGDLGLHEGPTLDDVKHFADNCRTRFADFPGLDVGLLRSHVDKSSTPLLTLAEPTPYKLGTLSGSWRGSYIVCECFLLIIMHSDTLPLKMPYLEDYRSWLDTLAAPPEFPTTGRFPLYMTLQEHFIRDSASVLPGVDATAGTTNAWLPAGLKWIQREVRYAK